MTETDGARAGVSRQAAVTLWVCERVLSPCAPLMAAAYVSVNLIWESGSTERRMEATTDERNVKG